MRLTDPESEATKQRGESYCMREDVDFWMFGVDRLAIDIFLTSINHPLESSVLEISQYHQITSIKESLPIASSSSTIPENL